MRSCQIRAPIVPDIQFYGTLLLKLAVSFFFFLKNKRHIVAEEATAGQEAHVCPSSPFSWGQRAEHTWLASVEF